MPKVIIHVLNVQESLGLMVFKNIQKQICLGQMEKPIREKMDFDQASKGHVLAHIRIILFTFQSPGHGYIKRQSKFQDNMFGLQRRSSKEKSKQQAIFQSSSQNLLNTFDELVTVQERLANPNKTT
ncbi:hypothetical protein YC2023_082363 [Brassica napus]